MSAYVQDSGWLGRRAVAFVLIILLHIVVFYGFASGFVHRAMQLLPTILDTKIIEEDKPKDQPPPPPPVELKERPPVQVVVPDINITVPADAPPPPITNTTITPVVKVPPKAVVVIGTPLVTTYAPNSEDYYPPASSRAGEQGRPVIKVCVGANGKLESAELQTTSGFPRLDDAAVTLGKAMRFKAATQDGKPIATCKPIAVKFNLREAK